MLYLILSVILGIILLLIFLYNQIIGLKYRMKEAWSGIDVQLKRRFDLLPNLVEVVKGYAGYERNLLERVTEIRSKQSSLQTIREKTDAENQISQIAKSLFAVAEAYPDLKANLNFLELQKGITEIEDQIQYARRYYNGTVRNYNIKIESFPGNLIAGVFKFESEEFFEIELATQKEAVAVKF